MSHFGVAFFFGRLSAERNLPSRTHSGQNGTPLTSVLESKDASPHPLQRRKSGTDSGMLAGPSLALWRYSVPGDLRQASTPMLQPLDVAALLGALFNLFGRFADRN